jgi:tight adherence protein C
MDTTALVAGGIVALLLIVASIILLRRSEEDPLSSRIGEFASRDEVASIEEIELSLPITDRIFVPIIRRISELVNRFAPQSMLENSARQLEVAGSPRNMSAATFLMIRGGLTVLMAGLFLLMSNRYGTIPAKIVLYTFIMAGIGFMLPQMMLKSMIDRRKEAIIKKFPDALDLMSICVDAGLTFDGAMSKVDEKWDDPLAREFGRVIYEIQLGKSRRQALRDLSDRCEVNDVTSFIAAVLQADQLGVSIGKVLRIQSEQMRIKRRQRAEEKAHQAPVKMMFPMVFLIFPSMFVVLLGPAGFQVMRSRPLE